MAELGWVAKAKGVEQHGDDRENHHRSGEAKGRPCKRHSTPKRP
jgi:hypothetical protein